MYKVAKVAELEDGSKFGASVCFTLIQRRLQVWDPNYDAKSRT